MDVSLVDNPGTGRDQVQLSLSASSKQCAKKANIFRCVRF